MMLLLKKTNRGHTSHEGNRCEIKKIQTDGRMKALVSITLDDAFVVHDLRVIEGIQVYL